MKITKDIHNFIRNLAFVFFGFMLAKGLLFVLHVAAGRILGPEEYGVYNLIASVAFMMSIFMLAGLHYSTTRYLATVKNEGVKKRVLSTSYLSLAFTSVLFLAVYIIFNKQITSFLKLTNKIFLIALPFSILLVMYLFSRYVLQGLHFMKKLSLVEIFHSIGTLAGFFILVIFIKNYTSILGGYGIGYLIHIILTIIFVKRFLALKLDRFYVKKIFSYAIFAFLMTSSAVLLGSVDKLMINYFLDYQSIGFYQAYFFSSMVIVGILVQIFLIVYFPTIIKYKKKRTILLRVDKLFLPLLIGICVLFPFIEYVALRFYGPQYPIKNILLILFAVSAAFFAIRNLYLWLQNSRGVRGVKISALGMLFAFIINIVLNYFLIPVIKLSGAVTATIAANVFLIIFIRLKLRRIK